MLHPIGYCGERESKTPKVEESKTERLSIEELLNKKFLIDELLDKKSIRKMKSVRHERAKSVNYSDFYDYVKSYYMYNKDVRGE